MWPLRSTLFVLVLLLAACGSTPPQVAYEREPVGPSDVSEVELALYQQHREWRGTEYLHGGLSKAGVDCSGFVYLTYRDRLGVTLPRTTQFQSRVGQQISVAQLQPGDLVFFKTGGKTRHVGIYVADNRFLHASKSRGVILSDLANPYWREVFWHARRI
nr:NlpC/P60 family protein [Litorivivens lipolytica]